MTLSYCKALRSTAEWRHSRR